MTTYVRKEFGNENTVPGPRPNIKKNNSTVSTLGATKTVGKVFLEPNATARGPLGELGNKQRNLKPSDKDEQISNKINTVNGTLKDNLPVIRSRINSVNENVCKAVPINKTQKLKVFKRQESILTKLVRPLGNINVKEDKEKTSNIEHNKAVVPTTTSYSSNQLVDIIDVDASDSDPYFVPTYIQDIMQYLLELEKRYAITKNYLHIVTDGQKHNTTPKMRSVLVNWMVEVHTSFQFLPETLHMSVAITDRYLHKMCNVGCKTLQLVGTIALYVASKYEEMYIPEISEFVYMCDDIYVKEDMFRMERDVLNCMGFELGGPLSLHFLRRYNKIAKVEIDHHALGKYLLELALIDDRVCHVLPSLQAAAACFLALVTLGTTNKNNSKSDSGSTSRTFTATSSPFSKISNHWTKTLSYYSTYSYTAIIPHVHNLAYLLIVAPTSKFQAVRSKYASSDYRKISTMSALQSPIVKKLAALSKI